MCVLDRCFLQPMVVRILITSTLIGDYTQHRNGPPFVIAAAGVSFYFSRNLKSILEGLPESGPFGGSLAGAAPSAQN